MLRELRITKFAIIDELILSFAPGMNVLTGETGAGKSIITRAIGLLCGDRGSADLIRSDSEEAEIEGRFELGAGSSAILDDTGLPAADELLVRRIIARSGKGRVYVNGSLATAGLLAQLGKHLIHVYGQHEQSLLLKPDSHIALLDDFGKLGAQREQMASAHQAFRAAADRLAALVASGEATRQRAELLRFQVKELRDAAVEPGEEHQLQQDREIERHAEKLLQVCRQGDDALYSGDQATAPTLGRLANQLQEAARIDPTFGGSADLLRQAVAQVEEVAAELRRTANRLQHDPERLEHIEERLAFLGRLKRKYACEADELPERLTSIENELAEIEGLGTDAGALKKEVLNRAAQAWAVARELSRARQEAAAVLEQRMAEELQALGMRGGIFRAVFAVAGSAAPQAKWAEADGLTALGADMVEFYLSANAGEHPKPLARVASGGELSRIMLALKTLTAGAGEVPTLIFDEVDAGIGGAVAEAVGKRLHQLGRSRQVLCITHLPQIAVLADHHFAVEKRAIKGRTITSARALRPADRVREISRMLGTASSPESQQYARQLMEAVRKTGPA